MSESKEALLINSPGIERFVWQKLVKGVIDNNGLPEDLHVLTQHVGVTLVDNFTKQVAAAGSLLRSTYIVPVDYELLHWQQINTAKFDFVARYHGNLIRQYPNRHLFPSPQGQIKQPITLFSFGGDIDKETESVIASMDRFGLRPTLSSETLAFARSFPEVQRQFRLVGLGSMWTDLQCDPCAMCLCEVSGRRGVRLYPWYRRWNKDYRFLTVPKALATM